MKSTGEVSTSRLTIKNLINNQTIFQKDYDGYVVSMYTRDLNGDDINELVLSWTSGLAGNFIEIYTVDATRARTVLNEFYRVDATLIALSGDSGEIIDVLITTAEGGAEPAYTTRYVWKGDRYQPAGRVPYESLANAIERQFNAPQQSHSHRRR